MIQYDTEGDKAIEWAVQDIITGIDRGKGLFDHHSPENQKKPETSTSKVAKALGLEKDPAIQRLLRKVERGDLQGESLPFDASDLIKCMQRTFVNNDVIVELGIRVVHDGIEFSRKKLTRNNELTKKIIEEFLADKKIIPPKFQQYLQSLQNPKFERPFDLGEILAVEGENAKELIQKLLEYEYQDSLNYLKALEEVKKAWKIKVKGQVIVADISDNPRFKDAARNQEKALITIQRQPTGHTQIYFDTERTEDTLVETLVSMIRLEECLVQGREIPKKDLRQPEYIEEVPEWYYFKAPPIPGKKKKPGRFILNGSLTAPNVLATKIPLEILREIVIKAVMSYNKFDWIQWEAERIAYYLSKNSRAREGEGAAWGGVPQMSRVLGETQR